MRVALLVMVLCLVGAGCGSTTSPSKRAANVIEKDWEGGFIGSNDPFPGHPELKGLSHAEVRCASAPAHARSVRCAIVASSSSRRVRIGAVARFDNAAVLRSWDFSS